MVVPQIFSAYSRKQLRLPGVGAREVRIFLALRLRTFLFCGCLRHKLRSFARRSVGCVPPTLACLVFLGRLLGNRYGSATRCLSIDILCGSRVWAFMFDPVPRLLVLVVGLFTDVTWTWHYSYSPE